MASENREFLLSHNVLNVLFLMLPKSQLVINLFGKAALLSNPFFCSVCTRCILLLKMVFFRRNYGSSSKEEDKLNVLRLETAMGSFVTFLLKFCYLIVCYLIC